MIETRAILAASYVAVHDRGLTHAFNTQTQRPLCRRVQARNLADRFAHDVDEPPTCRACLRADPRQNRTPSAEAPRRLERKDAIRLARAKFGNGVHVVDGGSKAPSGWRYKIRLAILPPIGRRKTRPVGEGRTWFAACQDAGIPIPAHFTEYEPAES